MGSFPVSLPLSHAFRLGVTSEGSFYFPPPAPSFLRELTDETVVLGQSVTLACQVSAQPAAQATWNKGRAILVLRGGRDRTAGVLLEGMSCPLTALPLCSATDGALLESSGRCLISSTLKNFHLLTLLVVTPEDLGMYTCSVSNALGTVATTAVLRKAGG